MIMGLGGSGAHLVGERPEEERREDPTDTCLLSPSPIILPSLGLLLPQPLLSRQGRLAETGRGTGLTQVLSSPSGLGGLAVVKWDME